MEHRGYPNRAYKLAMLAMKNVHLAYNQVCNDFLTLYMIASGVTLQGVVISVRPPPRAIFLTTIALFFVLLNFGRFQQLTEKNYLYFPHKTFLVTPLMFIPKVSIQIFFD